MENHLSKLSPRTRTVLHYISITGTHMMIFGFFLCLQQYTLGFVPLINKYKIFGELPISFIVFIAVSAFITKRFFKVSSPYK